MATTNAQRQRKHRDKRRTELQALRALRVVVPAAHDDGAAAAQVQRLTAQLEKASRAAAAQQLRIEVLEAEHGAALALRETVRALLPKLSPAARHVAIQHLQSCSAARWQDVPAPAPPAPARSPLTPHLMIF